MLAWCLGPYLLRNAGKFRFSGSDAHHPSENSGFHEGKGAFRAGRRGCVGHRSLCSNVMLYDVSSYCIKVYYIQLLSI